VKPYLPTKILGRNDNGGANGPGQDKGGGKDPLGGQLPGGVPPPDGANGISGGGSLIDTVGEGGPPTFVIPPSGSGGIHVDLGPNGELSDADEDRIEQFMNEYRNRFTGKGGGFGGSPFGGGGAPSGGGGTPAGGIGKGGN
jgi:hypothetical protein